MKYRPDMTPEEHAAFQAELAALDRAYEDAARFDAERAESPPDGEDWEDEWDLTHRAGLGWNGRP